MKKHWTPEFGKQGIIYPAVWRVLGWNRFFSPSMWLPKASATAIDLYLIFWWMFEGIFVLALTAWSGWRSWLLCGFLAFRLVDMFFVHMSILIKGFYRRYTDWVSSSRIVLLTLLNAIELMFVYGVFYWALSQLCPNAASCLPIVDGLFDGLYLSVVTATTLGYGTPHPIGWLTRLLAMLESSHLLLIVIAIISYARSIGSRPVDREQKERNETDKTKETVHGEISQEPK